MTVDSAALVSAIDLFCGAGGLSRGLREAGVGVAAGIDVDPASQYPFEENIEAPFVERDVRDVTAPHLTRLWPHGATRMLAGCAPCQPFSPYRRGVDTSEEEQWPLLAEFGRLVRETRPELVTMENVPRICSAPVFQSFVTSLRDLGYHLDWTSCNGLNYGLAQRRRRLVLLASLLGPVKVPRGVQGITTPRSVREEIGDLPPLASGATDAHDRLHASRRLSELNLRRIKSSRPGGTWRDWPEELRAPCHRKASGKTFGNVYARMEWDKPAPTITTLAHNYGTGRFGHPEQDRAVSLREAAMLQGFPRDYRFVKTDDPVYFTRLGRLIGNAVPPPIARALGTIVLAHAAEHVIGETAR